MTIKLFHGSLEQVFEPEIREPNRTLDYGSGGIIDKQQLIRELKTYKLVDQYLFHTFNALKHLHFLEAKEVMP